MLFFPGKPVEKPFGGKTHGLALETDLCSLYFDGCPRLQELKQKMLKGQPVNVKIQEARYSLTAFLDWCAVLEYHVSGKFSQSTQEVSNSAKRGEGRRSPFQGLAGLPSGI